MMMNDSIVCFVFFFKQKTAYEMRISDWSSDVCSSDLGTRDGEERHIGLAGDGARQQGFTRAGRTDQQAALGDLAAEALELLRVTQEFDDLFQLALGFLDAGNVFKGDAAVLLGQQPGLGLAEAHRLAAAGLHLAHEEDPDAEDRKSTRLNSSH